MADPTTLRHSQSMDILFPEEDQDTESIFSSTPSNTDTYSSYTQEVKYMFDTQISPTQSSDTAQQQYLSPHEYSNNAVSSPTEGYSNGSESSAPVQQEYRNALLRNSVPTRGEYQNGYNAYSKRFSYPDAMQGMQYNNNHASITPSVPNRQLSMNAGGGSFRGIEENRLARDFTPNRYGTISNYNKHPMKKTVDLNRSLDSLPKSLLLHNLSPNFRNRTPNFPNLSPRTGKMSPSLQNLHNLHKLSPKLSPTSLKSDLMSDLHNSVSAESHYPTKASMKGSLSPFSEDIYAVPHEDKEAIPKVGNGAIKPPMYSPGGSNGYTNNGKSIPKGPPPPYHSHVFTHSPRQQQQQQQQLPKSNCLNGNELPIKPNNLGYQQQHHPHPQPQASPSSYQLQQQQKQQASPSSYKIQQQHQPSPSSYQLQQQQQASPSSYQQQQQASPSSYQLQQQASPSSNKIQQQQASPSSYKIQPQGSPSSYKIQPQASPSSNRLQQPQASPSTTTPQTQHRNGTPTTATYPQLRPRNDATSTSSKDPRRKTWSPSSFRTAADGHSQGNQLTLAPLRSSRSNEYLDGATEDEETDFDEEGIVKIADDPKSGPPKIARISGILENSQTAHKSLIKPIACRPVLSANNGYAPQLYPRPSPRTPKDSPPPPPRPSPPNSYDAMKPSPSVAANNSHDDGYISQEYHSHTNSSASLQPKPIGGSGTQPMSPHDANHNFHHKDTPLPPTTSSAPKVTYLTDSGQKMVATNPTTANNAAVMSRADSGRPESFNSSSISRVSHGSSASAHSQHPADCSFTASPSDSGLGELEVLIHEKDAHIRQLRETMERNEMAILKVYEEKEQNWEIQFRDLHSDWEKKLRLQQQKAFKMEQALLMQLFKFQQERKSMRLDIETLRGEKQNVERQIHSVQDEVKESQTKLEESNWSICQKNGEISHLKSQIKESKDMLASKSSEILSLKSQLKESQRDNGEKNGEILGLESELKASQDSLKEARRELENVRTQLLRQKSSPTLQDSKITSSTSSSAASSSPEVKRLQDELVKNRADFEMDKDRWLAEKDKVIRYQRHLQLNYVQMANKNKLLEAEIQQLTLELESRDICLEDAKLDAEESVC